MRFVVFAATASLAFGQAGQVLQLTNNSQGAAEVAMVLRSIAEVQQVHADPEKGTVTVDGTPAQMAMAGWLFQRLNAPAKLPGAHEYRSPGGGDDVVRVFYLARAETPRDVQEIATAIRSVGDIRRVFIYSPLDALAIRGTGQQIALAAWAIDRLDAARSPASNEYKLPGDDVARIFELAHAQTPRDIQEMVTLVRALADITRVFACTARGALIARAPAERVALAAWLVAGLDRPAATAQDRAARHEYHFPSGPDSMVRVFYLAPGRPAKEYYDVATQVRRNARIPRLFVYNALGALAVRGTVGQVATAEKAIEELKAQ